MTAKKKPVKRQRRRSMEGAMATARARVQAELKKGMTEMVGGWDLTTDRPPNCRCTIQMDDPIRMVSLYIPIQLAPFKQLKLGAERVVKPGESAISALRDLESWLLRESVRIRLREKASTPRQPSFEEQARVPRPPIRFDDEF